MQFKFTEMLFFGDELQKKTCPDCGQGLFSLNY